MTIHTALKKIKTLTQSELRHCIQRIDEEIEYYKVCIENYPPDRMKRNGIPFLKMLEARRKRFVNRLNP